MGARTGQRAGLGTRPAAPDATNGELGDHDWRVVPHALNARIELLRRRDGYRAWSYESIGARVGCTGAAIRKILSGQTRQPDLAVVDRLAQLLALPRATFTAGALPLTSAMADGHEHDGRGGWDGLTWLGDSLLAAMERITDSTTQQVIEDLVRAQVMDSAPMPAQVPPCRSKPWRLDAPRLDAAIARSGLRNTEVAAAVRISEGAVRKMRRGRVRQPHLLTLDRLTTLLDVSVRDITTGDVPRLAHPAGRPSRCGWLSDEARAGLADLVDPAARAAVGRSIRLVVESAALRQMKTSDERPTQPRPENPH